MTDDQRKALKSLEFLKSLNLDATLVWLYTKGVLQESHVERIEAKKRTEGLTAARFLLLRILPTRGEKAFFEFYSCLLSKDGANQRNLADLLVSALPSNFDLVL